MKYSLFIIMFCILLLSIEEENVTNIPYKDPIYGSIFSGFWDNRGIYHFW